MTNVIRASPYGVTRIQSVKINTLAKKEGVIENFKKQKSVPMPCHAIHIQVIGIISKSENFQTVAISKLTTV